VCKASGTQTTKSSGRVVPLHTMQPVHHLTIRDLWHPQPCPQSWRIDGAKSRASATHRSVNLPSPGTNDRGKGFSSKHVCEKLCHALLLESKWWRKRRCWRRCRWWRRRSRGRCTGEMERALADVPGYNAPKVAMHIRFNMRGRRFESTPIARVIDGPGASVIFSQPSLAAGWPVRVVLIVRRAFRQ
jgi:hypothetical protein